MLDRRLQLLIDALGRARTLLILPHNNPDPDAISSAMALRYLRLEMVGLDSRIAYGGIIGRAENKALVRYLGHPLQPLTAADFDQAEAIALVDTQLGAGNVDLPPRTRLAIVIDHHRPLDDKPARPPDFSDFRPELGATSTLLVDYLRTADIQPATTIATALFYGIKTNTMGLARNVGPADAAAYYYLQSLIDVEALAEIERAQVPVHYFKSFDSALRAAKLYDGVVIAYIGQIEYPDLAAEIADMLVRLENSRWVFCMGQHEGKLILSLRARSRHDGAGRMIQAIVRDQGTSGGHGSIAGGQLPLRGREARAVAKELGRRALQLLNIQGRQAKSGKPLL